MELVLLVKYLKSIAVFALTHIREVAIVILTVTVIVLISLYGESKTDIKHLQTAHALELTTLRAEHQTQARKLEQQQYEQTITAINAAKKREQVLISDADRARDAVASLSNTIETLSANAASDAEFRDKYARTTGKLLVECSGQYSKMAETADRIANDLRAIQDARR